MADDSLQQQEPQGPPQAWWKKIFSSSPDASYGRAISASAFISLLALHILFSINPHGLFTVVNNQPQVLQYLFILVISGYSVTSAKDIVPQISTMFSSLFNKKPAALAAPTVATPDDKNTQ
jgi:hypothetical protein